MRKYLPLCVAIFSILSLFLVSKSKFYQQNATLLSSDLFLSVPVTPQAKNDFDGDGLSDLVDIAFDGATTKFYVRPSSNPGQLQVHTFAGKADFSVSGKWYYDGLSYPATVKKVGSYLEWTFANSTGQHSLTYGLATDLVPNQGDLDCDGRTDIITTRTNVPGYYERLRVWYIAPSSGGDVIETPFGLDIDEIGVADVDGDGCDELIAVRKPEYNVYSRKLSDTELNPTPIQWGAAGDQVLLPADINHDGLPDFIVVRNENQRQRAYVRLSHNDIADVLANLEYTILDLGVENDVAVTGNFFGRGAELGWVGRTGKSGINLDGSPFSFDWGNANNGVLRPDGTTASGAARAAQVTNIGRAAFAIFQKSFQCSEFLASLDNLPDLHIAILYDSFGNPFDGTGDPSCLLSLLNDPRLRSLQIHAINTVCYRNHNCAPYEFLHGVSGFNEKLASQDPATVARVQTYFAEIKKFLDLNLKSHTQCYISPGLENDLTRPASDNIVALARQSFPGCKIVNNPNGGSSNQNISGADFLEKHAINPNFGGVPGFSNNDGRDIKFPSSSTGYGSVISEADMKKHLVNASKSAHIAFVWIKEDNCRSDSGRQAPRDRVCNNKGRFKLAAKLIESLVPKGTAVTPPSTPTGNLACTVNVNVKDGGSKNFTYNPDNSRKKPKFIFPKEFVGAPDTATLITSQGNIACNRAYPDEHSNGPRPRWYCEIPVTSTPKNVTFVLSYNGQNYCASIPEPTKRYD